MIFVQSTKLPLLISYGNKLAIERAIISKNKRLLQHLSKQNEVKSVKELVKIFSQKAKIWKTWIWRCLSQEGKELCLDYSILRMRIGLLSKVVKNQIKVFEDNPDGFRNNKQNPFSVLKKAGNLTSLSTVSSLQILKMRNLSKNFIHQS